MVDREEGFSAADTILSVVKPSQTKYLAGRSIEMSQVPHRSHAKPHLKSQRRYLDRIPALLHGWLQAFSYQPGSLRIRENSGSNLASKFLDNTSFHRRLFLAAGLILLGTLSIRIVPSVDCFPDPLDLDHFSIDTRLRLF
jgi:hypothetical protein